MDPEDLKDAWQTLDRAYLSAVARRGPQVVFASVSGAHLYGFASPDSDVDLRGAFLLPASQMLGLRPPAETITVEEKTPLDLDWVAHDVRKFARMMTSHNGYVLEQLYSPLVVVETPAFEELRELGRGCLTRPTVRHYQGFARGRRQRLREPGATVKHLLYAYRVLLSGIHLMREREVVAHVGVLNRIFGIAQVNGLVERKRAGAEAMQLVPGELEEHERLLDALDEELTRAHDASSLPLEPTTREALQDFVVRLRQPAR
jgi:predicted nucleotidyltransferase